MKKQLLMGDGLMAVTHYSKWMAFGRAVMLSAGVFSAVLAARAQTSTTVTPQAQKAEVVVSPQSANAANGDTEPLLTLADAIAKAEKNQPAFAAAVAANKTAMLDRSIARSALLPGVVYHNQYLYTEGAQGATGSANASAGQAASAGTPRFIANNSVHEYTSQGTVTETIGVQGFNTLAHATAAATVANAELEIARRGLVATVVSLYYGSQAADRKVDIAQRAANEAADFTSNTQKREEAREVAHADVVKAQLEQQGRERELANARLDSDRAKLELAVLVYPDPRTKFRLTAFAMPAPLISKEDIQQLAAQNNAELKSALASLKAANLDVQGARAAYLPDLSLQYAYGIDAPQFAVHAPDGTRNLGYEATATLDIPVWDWLATHHRVQQKEAQRDVARVTLTDTQKRLIADLDTAYAEATVARDQLGSLAKSVDMARESLRLARLRYTAGEATVLEVVDAQTTVAAQENAQEDGMTRYEAAIANLQLLTGQSLTEQGPTGTN
ncbi:TolC family protein [Acidicapsa dinghuensis]|uniref:TolC family protein n=1 Tax=Acidicapsa dinghuensis TaxID=2218256 RepID=A0ABW1EGM6_9BACT|nr:TolC family protein [Acidicapsa dinghuensis]